MFRNLALATIFTLSFTGSAFAQNIDSTNVQTIDQSGAAVGNSTVVNSADQRNTTVNTNLNGRRRYPRQNIRSTNDQLIRQTGAAVDGSIVINDATQDNFTRNTNRRR